MEFVRKHFSKFVLGFACIFLALAIAFSAYSFASYVSRVEKNEKAGVGAIDCKVIVDGDDLGAFVNAPYIQTVGGSNVHMNDWSSANITLKNDSPSGVNYKFSFVFYVPQAFAECAMFQLLELESTGSNQVANASRIYRISDGGAALEEVTHMDSNDGGEGLTVDNPYQQYIDDGNELKIASDSHVDSVGEKEAAVKRSYATYFIFDSDGGAEESKALIAPASFYETVMLDYCRITVNLDGDSQYVLKSGQSHSYVFRLIPRTSIPESSTVDWSADKYWSKSESGAYVAPIEKPQSEDSEYEYRWGINDDGSYIFDDNGVPVIQAQVVNEASSYYGEWFPVVIGENTGMTNPATVSAVFTQSI